MKIASTLIVILLTLSVSAQKVIEKNLNYNKQNIQVDIPFASEIQVKTWDKNTVYFKADLTTEGGKYLDLYELNIEESTNNILISSQPKAIFEKFQEEHRKNNPEKDKYWNTNFDYEFNYMVYVPKNATFRISSINGDLRADVIEGNFTADLINGAIDIDSYAGDLKLNTINGEIDLVMKNTKMIAETINGNIYADEKMTLKTEDRHVGQKVEGSFSGGAHRLHLNTINGTIYLRI